MKYSRLFVMLLAATCFAALLVIAACGGDDDDGDDGGEATSPPAGNEIDISLSDDGTNSFFEPKEFTVEAGSTVTFNTTNDGNLVHNMRIAGADNKYNTADDAATEDYVNPGASMSFTWQVPDEPGTYKFRCDIHPTDMVGTITVE